MISIIVPVYNAAKYLRECIDSVLAQTYHDWELLLIDDGSTDKSGSICDEYSEKDSRIHVIHKKNRGASSARNHGIEASQGNWLMFLDADDTLTPHALEYCISKSDGVQMVCADCQTVHQDGKTPYKNTTPYNAGEYINSAKLAEDILIYKSIGGPVCKLISKEIIGAIRFKEGLNKGEDALFITAFLLQKDFRVFRSSEVIYKYRILPVSLSHGNSRKQISYIKELIDCLHNRYEEPAIITKGLQPAVAYAICFNYEEILSLQGWWKHLKNDELDDYIHCIQTVKTTYSLNNIQHITLSTKDHLELRLSIYYIPMQIKSLIKRLLRK